jgi:hypothetical protein
MINFAVVKSSELVNVVQKRRRGTQKYAGNETP